MRPDIEPSRPETSPEKSLEKPTTSGQHDVLLPSERRVRWPRGPVLIGAAVLALGAGVFALRAARTREPAPAAARRDVPFLDGNFIRFSDAFAKRIGVTVIKVRPKALVPVVNVTGTVAFDTRKFAAVGARIPGRVRQIYKIVGDAVAPGEPLAEIESAELGRAEAMLIGARAKEKAAAAEMKRERELAELHVSAAKEAEAAKAAFEAIRAERIATERTVQALGGDHAGELGNLILRSPIAGRVVDAKVARGQTVDPTVTAYEVADLSTVWVVLRVFERDLSSVRKGDRVEVIPQGDGAHPLEGTVDHVGEVVAADTRTAPLRLVIENKEGRLRPGQSVHARIHVQGPVGKTLAVPRAAISRVDGKPTVLLMVGPGTVEPRAVELGAADHDEVAVLDGLKEGDEIVEGGLFALKSEIFR